MPDLVKCETCGRDFNKPGVTGEWIPTRYFCSDVCLDAHPLSGRKPRTCFACTHSYMEPDSPLICGHKDAGDFGLSIHRPSEPLEHCKGKKFKQHPLRNPDGSLRLQKGDKNG